MPPRSIKPGCRVSAIPSRARADIPVVMNDAAAPPTLLYGRVKEHAPPPYRSWIVVWEVDSKETTVSAQALTPLDDPVVLPNSDEIKQSEGRRVLRDAQQPPVTYWKRMIATKMSPSGRIRQMRSPKRKKSKVRSLTLLYALMAFSGPLWMGSSKMSVRDCIFPKNTAV